MYGPINNMQVIQMQANEETFRRESGYYDLTSDSQRWNGCQDGWRFTWYKKPLLDSQWFTLYPNWLLILHFHSSGLPWTICSASPVMISVNIIITEHTATHSNHSSSSCCPNINKTNVTPSHWQGNSLQKVGHFHTHSKSETNVLQRRTALISPAWSFCAFHATSSDDVTCI